MSLANAGYRELPGYFVTKKMVKFHDLFANCWLEALAGVMTGVWRVQWETEVLQSGHTTSQSSERLKYYRVATPPPGLPPPPPRHTTVNHATLWGGRDLLKVVLLYIDTFSNGSGGMLDGSIVRENLWIISNLKRSNVTNKSYLIKNCYPPQVTSYKQFPIFNVNSWFPSAPKIF